jgi:tetratricopeptide (TPR) repeat protein
MRISKDPPDQVRRAGLTSALIGLLLSVAVVGEQTSESDAARREDAYRHNNIGVARLEQYDYAGAAAEFERALELQLDLGIARLNLGVARLYDGQLDAAAREAAIALERLPNLLHPRFVLGLIARADDRPDDAATLFQQVVDADPADAGSRIQLGQVRLGQRRFGDAASLFEAALRLEPFNATAAYGLATALTRGGDRERGETAMRRFQLLRDNPAAVTYSATYLEQGRYGEGLASTGLEPELIDPAVPAVSFVDATESMLPGPRRAARDASLADIDADGDLDLLLVREDGVHLLRNTKGRFAEETTIRIAGARAVLAGDYDNDAARDLAVLTEGSVSLFHQERDGSFRDVSDVLPPVKGPHTAAFVDADHDGDLDLVAGAQLLRNNGAGRFEETNALAQLGTSNAPLAIVPTDFDNRRDIDLLVVRSGSGPVLFSNQRDGTFRDVASEVGLPRGTTYTSVATGDINKDMAPDYFFGRLDGEGVFAVSAPGGRFTSAAAPAGTAGAQAAQLFDYDNDGLLDLIVLTSAGPRLWRSVGTEWRDVTAAALPTMRAPAFAIGDLDADGDEDIVAAASDGIRVWRNEGGSRRKSVRVQLRARVSNRDATGSKVELRAGSLRQRTETFATTPAIAPADIVFGLGRRDAADVVRVLWPAGILQAETHVTTPVATIEELDRKPSSCPFLYTWNGTRFEFVTDFLGGGEMGYWVAPGVRNVPDPDEYVRIPGEQLRPRNGRYELRITNELEEALFLDRLQLVAVTHPSDVDVYPNEGLRSSERRGPFALYTVRDAHPPLTAIDQDRRDVRERLVARDRLYVDGFRRASVQGYADQHWVAFDTGAQPSDARVLLLLTGWTDYAFSSDNVAAHQAGLAFRPPELQARDVNGTWQTVMSEIGLPVGRPQTVVVDATPYTRQGIREFRVVTTLRVYWDEILVDRSTPAPASMTTIEAASATLRWRGFSAEIRPDGREPAAYDYDRVDATAPWKLMPGRYTREGDVTQLIAATDDRFVVAGTGDEVAVSFDAGVLPPLRGGWARTFLLHADGFSKEMNLHSASPDVLEPLPFHAMRAYPYVPPERYPDTPEHRRYRDEYNTRVIGRALPPLERTR